VSTVLQETIQQAYKPYDIVTDANGNAGFIQEVNVNVSQPDPENQISYSIKWLTGNNSKVAWYEKRELVRHCNLFTKIAEVSCHPMGQSERWVSRLLGFK
jgi:hypothetical protein